MPRPVVPSRVSSASSVMLLAAAMRPLMPMAARARNSSGLVHDMAVAAGTRVAGRVLGLATHRADGPSRLHEGATALDEGGRLGAREMKARDGGLLLRLLFEQLAGLQHHAIAVLIVAHAERGY